MANYKRRYPRTGGKTHISTTTWRKKQGLKPCITVIRDKFSGKRIYLDVSWGWRDNSRKYYQGYPRSHDIVHHSRPTRRKNRQVSREILMSDIMDRDPLMVDDMVFPLAKKPHKYYW